MRAVAYCRVSTNSDDQINSLKNQKKNYLELFENKKYDVADTGLLYRKDGTKEFIKGIYADEGISGTSIKNRIAFMQMLEDAKRKEFDIIYVKSISRFAREVETLAKVLKDLKELGIGVQFELQRVNSLDSSREFIINMFASQAQEDSRLKSDAIQYGIRKAQNQGK